MFVIECLRFSVLFAFVQSKILSFLLLIYNVKKTVLRYLCTFPMYSLVCTTKWNKLDFVFYTVIAITNINVPHLHTYFVSGKSIALQEFILRIARARWNGNSSGGGGCSLNVCVRHVREVFLRHKTSTSSQAPKLRHNDIGIL